MRAHPRRRIGIRQISSIALVAGVVVLGGGPGTASATAGQPVSGACTIDAGFDGQLLTADDDFAPSPSGGDIVSAGADAASSSNGSSGDGSAFVGEACWVSAAPPVPAPVPTVRIQSSPSVPAAAQLPTPAEATPSAQPVSAAQPVASDRSAQMAAADIGRAAAAPAPLSVGSGSGGVSMALVAVAASLALVAGAGWAGLRLLRRRRPTWQ